MLPQLTLYLVTTTPLAPNSNTWVCISPMSDLKDITDINTHLCQAKVQTAALGTFFHSSTNTWSKCLIFLALPVNTALYGAESLTLTIELQWHISLFYHTTIWCILGVNMHHVEQFWIRSKWTPMKIFPSLTQLTSYGSNNSTYLASMLAWTLPISHANSSLLGSVNPTAPMASTTPYASPTSTCSNMHVLPNVPDNGDVQPIMAPSCAEVWILETNWNWVDQAPAGSHHVSQWAPSSLWRQHPWPQISMVLTWHTVPELNDKQTNTNGKTPLLALLSVFICCSIFCPFPP